MVTLPFGELLLILCPFAFGDGVAGGEDDLCKYAGGNVEWGEKGSSVPQPGLGRSSEGEESPLEEFESSSSAFSASALRFLVPFLSFFDFLIETRK